jgi:hypothetical protein
MSKQRQRDRAAREVAAAAQAARAADATTRADRRARRRPPVPARPARPRRQVVYRSRRFPPLPWRLKLVLALVWATAALLTLVFVPTWTGRLGFLVVATFALPLIVVLVHDPSRRTR